jgi:D-alanyl-D-alanine carboxypeptidase
LVAGTKVGQAVFELDGREIGRVDLLCGESVAPRIEPALRALKLPG